MAEIKIEKKKPIWPWIILVLVILALLYFLVFDDDDDIEEIETEQIQEETGFEEDESASTSWEEETAGENGKVAGFLALVSENEGMGIDHEYANNALMSLIEAVEEKANELDVDISAELAAIATSAEKIKQDPMAATHANTIKEAGTQLAEVLQTIQEAEYPDLEAEVNEVQTAVQEIAPDVETLNQKDQIKKFFEESADVLRKMS